MNTNTALAPLQHFLSYSQRQTLRAAVWGEERKWFRAKLVELGELTRTMARTYEQDGKGDDATVYLHYFNAASDWYITERDTSDEQHQAFGLASMNGCYPEMGYISIVELIAHGAELDLHFTPKPLRDVRAALVA